MKVIVEPKQSIIKLWGKQSIKQNKAYRLMRYVLRVNYKDQILLHNVVTGQLVILNQDEVKALDKPVVTFNQQMENLVNDHYLVPEDYDEHQQVVKLRNILWWMADAQQSKVVTSYLILPTTACNARCWYCYEKGVMPTTMTEETANDVVSFIGNQCQGKRIYIRWFGGEPTLAVNRINQICEGLKRKKIQFFSSLTTNGYLLDSDLIAKAKSLWTLKHVMVSIDGTEETYNRVKAFEHVTDNPYLRMMNNIGILLREGISVAIRVNFDQDTYQDFVPLLMEVKRKFGDNPKLIVCPHQININRHYQTSREFTQEELESYEIWLKDKIVELFDATCSVGAYRRKNELPCLSFKMCAAANDNATVITPEGYIVSCGEQLSEEQILGNVKRGVFNKQKAKSWKEFADYKKCHDCELFPVCARIVNCKITDQCCYKKEKMKGYHVAIERAYDSCFAKIIDGRYGKNASSGTNC